mmetsp:Transcript_1956/g.4682  ORF Transcript_1956/g.4682 Transcript_1956/m.4682 type:complete len:202 (+) Transcript_1956:3176-3781(+)
MQPPLATGGNYRAVKHMVPTLRCWDLPTGLASAGSKSPRLPRPGTPGRNRCTPKSRLSGLRFFRDRARRRRARRVPPKSPPKESSARCASAEHRCSRLGKSLALPVLWTPLRQQKPPPPCCCPRHCERSASPPSAPPLPSAPLLGVHQLLRGPRGSRRRSQHSWLWLLPVVSTAEESETSLVCQAQSPRRIGADRPGNQRT